MLLAYARSKSFHCYYICKATTLPPEKILIGQQHFCPCGLIVTVHLPACCFTGSGSAHLPDIRSMQLCLCSVACTNYPLANYLLSGFLLCQSSVGSCWTALCAVWLLCILFSWISAVGCHYTMWQRLTRYYSYLMAWYSKKLCFLVCSLWESARQMAMHFRVFSGYRRTS